MNTAFVELNTIRMPVPPAPTAAAPRAAPGASPAIRVRRGETLLHAGAPFDSLFSIRSGFFKSNVIVEDGRAQVVGFHMGGEVLGLEGMGTGRHSADVTALEDSEVSAIPRERLDDPAMQRQLHQLLCRELVRGQGVMLLLGTMRSEERLASFLLGLSQRFLACGYSPHEFHLRMTRDEIGSYLGLSLETVSRLFSRFRDEGLIAVRQKYVRILDVHGLRATMLH
jgi:CRP/FNR family transcriptional regulator